MYLEYFCCKDFADDFIDVALRLASTRSSLSWLTCVSVDVVDGSFACSSGRRMGLADPAAMHPEFVNSAARMAVTINAGSSTDEDDDVRADIFRSRCFSRSMHTSTSNSLALR